MTPLTPKLKYASGYTQYVCNDYVISHKHSWLSGDKLEVG